MTRSDIDHYVGLEIWNPFGMAELWGLLVALPLRRGLDVIDVGCGEARALARIAAQHGARITGVDRSATALARARAYCRRRAPGCDATWIEGELDDLDFGPGSFDLILSFGGPYRVDSREATFRLYREWLRPDGHLVYGDGFWLQPPPDAYVEALGIPSDALLSRSEYLAQAERCGIESVDHFISTREAWDRFEGTLLRSHEEYARAHPHDRVVQDMLATKRAWNAAQQRWGRETMGFCVDVFGKRSSP